MNKNKRKLGELIVRKLAHETYKKFSTESMQKFIR